VCWVLHIMYLRPDSLKKKYVAGVVGYIFSVCLIGQNDDVVSPLV